MQLIYGKFDPELNPPPFSQWSKAFSGVEVDLFQYYSWKPKVVSYFQTWVERKDLLLVPRIRIRTQRAAEEYQDAIQIWNQHYSSRTFYFSVYSGRKEWEPNLSSKELKKIPSHEKYFFEWGQNDSVKTTQFLKSLNCFQGFVVDPGWHLKSISLLEKTPHHFKLHGWNSERWVRRYGPAQSAQMSKTVHRQPNASLTLSYSGKAVEAPFFCIK